jgi:hypothetical protein
MKNVIDNDLIAEVDRMPDWVLVKVHPPERDGQAWYATMDWGAYIHGNADFSTGGRSRDQVIAQCAGKIRNDMRGVGKFATHFDDYVLRRELIPYWKRKRTTGRTETYFAASIALEIVDIARDILGE